MKKALFAAAVIAAAWQPSFAGAQGRITTPREALGHDIGEDYFLATRSTVSTTACVCASTSMLHLAPPPPPPPLSPLPPPRPPSFRPQWACTGRRAWPAPSQQPQGPR